MDLGPTFVGNKMLSLCFHKCLHSSYLKIISISFVYLSKVKSSSSDEKWKDKERKKETDIN